MIEEKSLVSTRKMLEQKLAQINAQIEEIGTDRMATLEYQKLLGLRHRREILFNLIVKMK